MESPPLAIDATAAQPLTERVGTQIGPYKLLEQIGEGGMGTVYMAAQKEPVRRTVALKVIKPGMDTQQVVARFEAERQALALMNHPNIAKVLDAGTTESKRPYFVMELVKGIPITDFCDGQKLNTRGRLQLFITLCQAVQHSHQKGLIHRDLKPSNVLVEMHDVTPVPKVIDFGVAKAIGQQLTEMTLHTGFNQMIGTPLYMSPEQAGQSSIDVDTRSDIYSLGVLLYELLTGTTPFDKETLTEAGYDEMRRMIREVDPPRPSARVSTLQAQALSTVSDCRKIEPRKLSQQLCGELDWIVMKALEKDRSRRYESASAFAADVQRHLDDQPVEACPPSMRYRLRKFARRNRGPVLAVLLLVLVLAGGVIGTTRGLVLVDRAREAADHHRLVAEERAGVLRSRLYVADMNQAFKHWEQGEIDELLAILDSFDSPAERASFEWRYLRSLARTRPRELVVFRKHESSPFSAVFAPDGQTVASCGTDRCIRFWDATTGQEEKVLRPRPETASQATQNHKEDENCVRYSLDGRHLASACEDGTVRLWDLTPGVWKALSPKHNGEVLGLASSWDGKLLAAAGVDRIVRIWTATDQVLVAELTGHQATIQGLAFSPDGRSVASADRNGLVILWDVVKPGQRAFLRSGSGVFGVDYSPDGAFLATAEANGVVRLWDAASGRELRELGRHFDQVRNVQFSPDGKLLASCGDDGCIRIWHVDGTSAAHFRAHQGVIWSVAFSPDCRKLVSVSNDRTTKVWDLSPLGPPTHWAATRNIPASQIAFAPRSRRLAMSTADGRILVGDAAARGSLETLSHQAWPHSTLVFSPDERQIIFTFHDRSVQSWIPTERRAETIFPPHQAEPPGKWATGSHAIHLYFPVDQPLATVYWDGLLRTLEGGRVRERRITSSKPTGLSPPILAWSSDGARVAIYYPDAPGIGRLDLKTGAPCPEIHSRRISSLSLSPSGSILATVGDDSSIKLIDWATGEEFRTLAGLRKSTHALLFSGDGRTLIGASGDGAVRLWHVETGQELFTLGERSGRRPNSMALSSDGNLLAVAGDAHEDGSTVTIYDIGAANQPAAP